MTHRRRYGAASRPIDLSAVVISWSLLATLATGCAPPNQATDPASAPSASVTDSTGPVPELTEEPSEEPSEEPAEPEEDPIHRFGDTAAYENGLRVTVGKLKSFKPSATAIYRKKDDRFVQFEVVIKNGSNRRYKPNIFSTTASTGDRDAEQVIDPAKGISGPPRGVVLRGKSKRFVIAYGVEKGEDFVLEVQPDFESEAVIFSS